MNKMECEDKGMEVDVMGNDVCELIESLKIIWLKRLEKYPLCSRQEQTRGNKRED